MLNPPVNGKIQGLFKALSVFQVLFKGSLIFKDFSRQSCIFKYFSSLCKPCVYWLHWNSCAWSSSDVIMSCHHVMLSIQELLGHKMWYLMVGKQRILYFCEDGIENLSLVITLCHHATSLMMSKGDPWDEFFYHILTLTIDSYILYLGKSSDVLIQCARRC